MKKIYSLAQLWRTPYRTKLDMGSSRLKLIFYDNKHRKQCLFGPSNIYLLEKRNDEAFISASRIPEVKDCKRSSKVICCMLLYRVIKKMYFSLIKRKIKTIPPIFKILAFLNQDFFNLNFDKLFYIFHFVSTELFNF